MKTEFRHRYRNEVMSIEGHFVTINSRSIAEGQNSPRPTSTTLILGVCNLVDVRPPTFGKRLLQRPHTHRNLGPRSAAVRAQRLTPNRQSGCRCVPFEYQCMQLVERTTPLCQIVRSRTCQHRQHRKQHLAAPSTVQHLQFCWRSRMCTSLAAG